MQHNFDKYFDTSSEYWQKVQKIYDENDQFPKIVVKNRNLHHKFMRSFSHLEGTEIDNDKDNLVSLSEGDHFLVHYYLWKCTKQGFRRQTGLPVRFMYKKAAKYLTDEIAELISKEWTCKGYHHSEETKKKMKGNQNAKGKRSEEAKRKMSEAQKGNQNAKGNKGSAGRPAWNKGKPAWNRGKKTPDEIRKKLSESHKGNKSPVKGKHWKLVNGKRVYY